MNKFIVLQVVAILGIVLGLDIHISQPQEPILPYDETVELEIITAINAVRIRDGRVPLLRNNDLDFLASQQATYISRWLPLTQGDIQLHQDSFKNGIDERATFIGWQGYGFPSEVYVDEIAAYYPSVEGMMDFWNNSDVHREAIYDFGYREIGVSVVRNNNWYLAYVVFGARPNVLPVMYFAEQNKLYLNHDQSGFPWVFVPSRIQILNEDGERLHDEEWLLWRPRIDLPTDAGDVISVVYSDGINQITNTVTLSEVRVYPSEPMPDRADAEKTVPESFTIPQSEESIANLTESMTNSDGDVRIEYDGRSISIINQAGHDLNFEPFVIYANASGATITSDFIGAFSDVPLSALRHGDCMQMWSFQQTPIAPPLPDNCETLVSGRSVLTLGDRFWLVGSFEVMYNQRLIAICEADVGSCEFNLPER